MWSSTRQQFHTVALYKKKTASFSIGIVLSSALLKVEREYMTNYIIFYLGREHVLMEQKKYSISLK